MPISTPNSELTANKNLLSVNAFKVVISDFPNVNFFIQGFTMPNVSVATTQVSTNDIMDFSVPSNKINFEELNLTFILDEDIEAYKELYNWFLTCVSSGESQKSDLSVLLLTNNRNLNKKVVFKNIYPINLSGFTMDYRQGEDLPVTVDVTFKYSHFSLA